MPTNQTPKAVLVAGATGRLGALACVLCARGHSVRAMTRAPDSSVATRLRAIGVFPVYGDFEDAASIEAAARGADAVFATGTAHRVGPAGEARHGRNLADAVAAGRRAASRLQLRRRRRRRTARCRCSAPSTAWRGTSDRSESRTRSWLPCTSWRTCSTLGTCRR